MSDSQMTAHLSMSHPDRMLPTSSHHRTASFLFFHDLLLLMNACFTKIQCTSNQITVIAIIRNDKKRSQRACVLYHVGHLPKLLPLVTGRDSRIFQETSSYAKDKPLRQTDSEPERPHHCY